MPHPPEHSRFSLERRAFGSGVAVVSSQAATALVSALTVVVLARLLTPADFGLVAMAIPLVALGMALRGFGLDFAAMQDPALDASVGTRLFRRAFLLNLLLVLGLIPGAFGLAWFFGEARVIPVGLGLTGAFFVLSTATIPEAVMKRDLRFRAVSSINLAAAAGGSTAAILLAFAGAGYWALAAQTGVMLLSRGVLLWTISGWRPVTLDPGADPGIPSRLRRYAREFTVGRVMLATSSSVDRLLVGWLAGPVVLGFYENARRFAFLILENLYAPLLDVAVAGLSRTHGEPDRHRLAAGRAVELVLALILPSLLFAIAVMEPLILLILGPRWEPVIPFARLLTIAALAQSVGRLGSWFLLAEGRADRQRRWNTAQSIIMLLALTGGAVVAGPIGVATGLALVSWLLAPCSIIYALRSSAFPLFSFLKAMQRPVLFAIAAFLALWLFERAAGTALPNPLLLLRAALIFLAVYLGGWLVWPGGPARLRRLGFTLARGLAFAPRPEKSTGRQ